MRKRIKVAICSSDNYEATKRVHIAQLKREHELNKAFIAEIPIPVISEIIPIRITHYDEVVIKQLLMLDF